MSYISTGLSVILNNNKLIFADIDNDRDADLFVGSNDSNILYFRNLSNLGIQIAETNDAPKIVGTNSVIVKSAETFVQHLSVTDEEGHGIYPLYLDGEWHSEVLRNLFSCVIFEQGCSVAIPHRYYRIRFC